MHYFIFCQGKGNLVVLVDKSRARTSFKQFWFGLEMLHWLLKVKTELASPAHPTSDTWHVSCQWRICLLTFIELQMQIFNTTNEVQKTNLTNSINFFRENTNNFKVFFIHHFI